MTNVIVKRTEILCSSTVVYTAWVPSSYFGNHSSVTTIDGQTYGQVGRERLPKELDALPSMSDERYQAVKAWHEEQYQKAYAAILAEYPNLKADRVEMGEMVTY